MHLKIPISLVLFLTLISEQLFGSLSANKNDDVTRNSTINYEYPGGQTYSSEGNKILTRHARQVLAEPKRQWPDRRVPYQLDRTFSDKMKALIEETMKEFRMLTCIRFKKRKSEPEYLFISNNQSIGCTSNLGKAMKTKVTLSNLNENKCRKKGFLIHELMHTLGFIHEHQRPDRDKFVTVKKKNIREGKTYRRSFRKFGKKKIKILTPYSFNTILHYGSYSFSKNDKKLPTLVKQDGSILTENEYVPNYLPVVDVLRLNIQYNCTVKIVDLFMSYVVLNSHLLLR